MHSQAGAKVRHELEFECKNNCMVSALLYISTCDSKDKGGCEQILKMLLQNMDEKRQLEIDERKRALQMSASGKYKQVTKEDIRFLRNLDKESKYEIEKSSLYIGYKFLWIIKMFLEGKKFPNGELEENQWRVHVYDIVEFVTVLEHLVDILEFDPE